MFVYAKRTEAELFVMSDFIKALSMVIDMLLMTSGTFNGLIIIYDMKGFSLSHIGRLGINMMKKYVYFLQVCDEGDDWNSQWRAKRGQRNHVSRMFRGEGEGKSKWCKKPKYVTVGEHCTPLRNPGHATEKSYLKFQLATYYIY